MKCAFLLVSMLTLASAPLAAQPVAPRYVGVSSCSGLGCHGSPQDAGRAAALSSYTVWATQDPHADAGVALLTDRSRQMVRILQGAETSVAEHGRVVKDRCIGCHTTPNRHILAEGVSCEACHGPAAGWLESHTRTSWTRLTAAEQLSHGMTNTRDLRERAALCTRCHIGPALVEGRLHDVNHDLIAAGHPRLAFEFSSYLAQMPPHWDTARDRGRTANFDAAAWTAGQGAAARAGLELLRARAERSQKDGVWPELAEFDCAACHHALGSPYAARSAAGHPGQLVGRTWNYLPTLLGLTANRRLPALEQLLSDASLDAATVSSLASQGLEQLASQNPPTPSTLSAPLAENLQHWEQAVHLYLAAAALSGSYASRDADALKKLSDFRACLEQPLPRTDLLLTPEDARQPVAYAFDPNHPQFRRALEELLKLVP